KTTAVAALAQHLTQAGKRVGLITNDQGSELVDTAMLRARGFSTEEIPGGCFCCRFNSLVDAARKLTDATKPDAFVAEPVGSCTDLVATVGYPLRRMYGERFRLAPLSVLIDPVRAEQVFGMREGRKFSEKVLYIWRKQVEEADIIVIAKSDLLDPPRLEALRQRLAKEFPGKKIIDVSVRHGAGVQSWFKLLNDTSPGSAPAMEIDYDIYADGEALLGWLNATIELRSRDGVDATAVLQALAHEMKSALTHAEIAHLKMTLSPDDSLAGEIAALSLVRSDIVPELSMELDALVVAGQLIVNCRAETSPEELRSALEKGVTAIRRGFPGLEAKIEHIEQFRPGRPQPTHRLETPESSVAA
ncbi:MAG: cobalamin biosynthesis protein P47K, partial [Planctomycetaceae bacterium]|nr:cobalamin biosynthesis protein P47K [Planctomycetaceae bacterium]